MNFTFEIISPQLRGSAVRIRYVMLHEPVNNFIVHVRKTREHTF